MKVDLVELRKSVERELVELEERRSTLREQMLHIEAVQQIAGANASVNADGQSELTSLEAAVAERRAQSQRKHWFRG